MNEELSRSYIQKLLKEQKITVNGSAVKANYKVQEGDEISVAVPDIKEPDILPEDIPLDILYEDDLNEDESEDKSKKDNKQKDLYLFR